MAQFKCKACPQTFSTVQGATMHYHRAHGNMRGDSRKKGVPPGHPWRGPAVPKSAVPKPSKEEIEVTLKDLEETKPDSIVPEIPAEEQANRYAKMAVDEIARELTVLANQIPHQERILEEMKSRQKYLEKMASAFAELDRKLAEASITKKEVKEGFKVNHVGGKTHAAGVAKREE